MTSSSPPITDLVKHETHVPCLRARERAKTQWKGWLPSTFLNRLFVHVLVFFHSA